MTKPVVHFEIGGLDLDRLVSFYSELFGWQLQPAGPEYSLIPGGGNDVSIGGGLLQTHGEMPPCVTVYIAVDDRAGELGGTTVVEPTAVAGIGQFALFRDLDGNVVGLLQDDDQRTAEPGACRSQLGVDLRADGRIAGGPTAFGPV
ncbi:hypothetical protein EV644_15513 [Kribbella orskensis]|uniref:VOC domain-containing protein n=1 Tax=Kribbella orskensis TaxID=2512216 RepID=A0ABY2B6E5_9ACTN|nr:MULTISPECIES: VOC family protein [Kribbella]TCN27654.1 hypothetical protein EV642_15813 [Kribbella sp. VKM Ac-2500]TCO07576.1 hypothetical protein EV644_15513 [Kribbella orskensis]